MSGHASARVTRREAIARVSALFGGVALVGHSGLLEALQSTGQSAVSATEVALLDEIADTLLPETGTPGAKAAGVGAFMALMVQDAYSPEEQRIFREGVAELESACREMCGRDFMSATAEERLRLLEKLDREQHDYMEALEDDGEETPVHYFRMMKQLALLGYFTSEVGYTKAMRYRETPGRFDPCVPYKRGEKAWATHA